jgi:hypothetical protein
MRGAGFNTALHVKRDSCPEGSEVGCDDGTGSSDYSRLVTSLTAGTYYVFVDGSGADSSGAYELRVHIAVP